MLAQQMIGHNAPISGVAARPPHVATAGYDNQIILWDHRTRRAMACACHDHLANQVVFSPDAHFLATASSDYTARVWSVPDLRLRSVLADHDDDVEMVAFSPSGDRLATASRDHNVRVFDLKGGLLSTMVGHQADVISVAWSADGSRLISSSDDATVREWDPVSGRQVGSVDMNGVETDTLVCDPRGTIYAGNDDGEIAIIRAGAASAVPAHNSGIKRLVLADRRLVSLSYDRTLRVWNIAACGGIEPAQSAEMPSVIWPRSCAFNGDTELVFATFGSSYATFNLRTGQWDLSGIEPTGGVNAVTVVNGSVLTVGDAGIVRKDGRAIRDLGSLCNFLTPFDDVVLTGGQMGHVFDALSGDLLYTHKSPLNCAATFMRAGTRKAIVGAYTGEGLIFSKNGSGKVVLECVARLHTNAVKGLACNNESIFSVCATGAAAWHSIADCHAMRQIADGHSKIANGCAAVGGQGYVSVSRDRKLRIWSGGGNLIEVIDTPHTHSIKCVAASVDGRFVATASYFGRASVYDVRKRFWIFDRRLTRSGISSLAVSAAGFLAGAYDGNVYPIAF